MEALEGRQLLAGVSFSNGVLTLVAPNNQGNTIEVYASGANIVGKVNATTKSVAASTIKSIKITGGNWNDTIRVNANVNKRTDIDGNAGNDSLYGDAGKDLLDGGSGSDFLQGGADADTVKNGESGDVSSPSSTPATSGTTSSVSVSALELWDASTNRKVQTLSSGATLDLAKLPSKFTFVAQGTAASVKFGLDAKTSYRIENQKPWSITGDLSGKVMPLTIATGSHTVKVTPYTKTNASGTAGATKTYTFNVIKTGTSTTPPAYNPSPTPAPSQPSPTPSPTPSTTTGIAVRNASAPAPVAIISKVSNSSIHANQSFSANAMDSKLNFGTPLTARYVWDFDDAGSKYNIMEGFNAAHYYDTAGVYDVKLTVTNEAGKSSTATLKVNVASAGRKKIYVSNTGNDANDGLSEAKPIKSWDKARTKVGDNVELLFHGGQTFEAKTGINIYGKNFLASSYGGGKATLKYTGPRDYGTIFWLGGGTGEETITNLVFDSIYTDANKAGLPQAIGVNGTGNTIINNEFRYLGYAVNAFSKPKGMLVQDNTAPVKTGLRGYFSWVGGEDHVFVGNVVSNVDGHVIRMSEMNRINVSNNDFTNPNETSGYRGTLTIHSGSYAYVRNNTLNDGWFSVGPLGNEDGLTEKASRFNWSVFENNTVNRSRFIVLHGANHTMFRNNVIKVIDDDWGVEIQGYNTTYARGVEDVEIINNTVITNSTTGNFLRVGGPAKGITVVNNLFLAPKLITGTSGAAPVFVYDNDLSSFDKITNNVWAMPTILQYAQGGINYVWPNWSNAAGYKTPAEWNAIGQVGTDYFEDLTFNSTTGAATGGTNRDAGTVWAGVFTDKNGKIRPASGGWTVGAIEA